MITMHQRAFRHIMKPSLIAQSTLVPTTPLSSEDFRQPFTDSQCELTEACRQRLVSCPCKMRPAAHSNITKGLHMMTSQKCSKVTITLSKTDDGGLHQEIHSFIHDEADQRA